MRKNNNKTEAIDVVDRGYFDYKLLDRLHNDGYFFVTRTKSNNRITVLDQIIVAHPKTTDGTIISDQQVCSVVVQAMRLDVSDSLQF